MISFDLHSKELAKHPQREAFFRTRDYKHAQLTVIDVGTFWLVKSDDVQIQGRYEHRPDDPRATSLTALAVSGPFLNHNVLVIRTLFEKSTWNGEEILPAGEIPSVFLNGFVRAIYHKSSEIVKDGTRGPGIDIELPSQVKLIVNRWNSSMDCSITMPPHARGQSGQCGNFNGDASDDLDSSSSHAHHRPEAHELFELQARKS